MSIPRDTLLGDETGPGGHGRATLIAFGLTVLVRGTPILGGVSNLAEGSSLPDDAPRLRVDVLAILGGVEIKHDK